MIAETSALIGSRSASPSDHLRTRSGSSSNARRNASRAPVAVARAHAEAGEVVDDGRVRRGAPPRTPRAAAPPRPAAGAPPGTTTSHADGVNASPRLRADREHRRARLERDRRALHRRVGQVDDRAGGRVDLLAVEGERRVAGDHDVDLLVAEALLGVLLDHLAADLGRRVRVRSRTPRSRAGSGSGARSGRARRPGSSRARTGSRRSSSCRGVSQVLEHDRVDRLLAVDALLEVLDARPVGEALVAERGEPLPAPRRPARRRAPATRRAVSCRRAHRAPGRGAAAPRSGAGRCRREGRRARPRGRRSRRLARRRAARPTAARAGLRPPPGPRRDRRAAAPRAEAARSRRRSLRARPRSPPRPGCSPARRSTGPCGPRPTRCTASP